MAIGCQAQWVARSSSYLALGLPTTAAAPRASGHAAPSLDPLRQVGDLLRREPLLGRHLRGIFEEWFTAWISRLFSGSPGTTAGRFLPLDQAVAVVDPQAPFELVLAE